MPEEVKPKAEAEKVPVVTSTVTDAELNAAAEGKTTEEKVVEELSKEEPKPQPIEKTPEEVAAE